MSVLAILIPPRARLNPRAVGNQPAQAAAEGYSYALSADGLAPASMGQAQPALLPRADSVVAVLADSDVAWHRVTLPKAPAARLRAALGGLLEEHLLDDDEVEPELRRRIADAAVREAMSWIGDYRTFFEELSEVTTCVCEVEREVKQHGLSALTADRCARLLMPVSTPKGRCFVFDMLVYVHTTLALTTVQDAILCTSDILESAFGKYKNYVSRNPMAGITDLALCLAAFTCSLSSQEIAEALEHTTVHDVADWARMYLEPTLLKKRRDAFQELKSQK